MKDTTDFINFIENTQISNDVVLATLDVSYLTTKLPQTEGIDIICHHYKKQYEHNLPIPTNDYGNFYRSYSKRIISNLMKDTSYKHKASLWELRRQLLSLFFFMADIDKQPLITHPYKPLVWKRFVDDIFSLLDISTKEVYNFVDFANTFHPTNIKFTCEIKSSECTVFLDTEVFKGPRLSTHKILGLQTHLKPTETFQYTHFSSCHPSN